MMMEKEKSMDLLENEKGQSTTEFLMTFIFGFVIIFIFLKMSFTIGNGYLVHYATFMASRTYLVMDNNSNNPNGGDAEAFKRAGETFLSFLVDKLVPGWKANLQVNSPGNVSNQVFTGLWIEMKEQFGVSDLIGGKKPINLRSESFLGREPTISECMDRICKSMKLIGGDCRSQSTMFDNGC